MGILICSCFVVILLVKHNIVMFIKWLTWLMVNFFVYSVDGALKMLFETIKYLVDKNFFLLFYFQYTLAVSVCSLESSNHDNNHVYFRLHVV